MSLLTMLLRYLQEITNFTKAINFALLNSFTAISKNFVNLTKSFMKEFQGGGTSLRSLYGALLFIKNSLIFFSMNKQKRLQLQPSIYGT